MFSDLLRELVKGIKYVPKNQRMQAFQYALWFGIILAILNFIVLVVVILISR